MPAFATRAIYAVACAAAVALAAQTPLTLVSTAWPPFTNAPGQPRFALDLVEAAFGRIGVAAKTTIVDAARFTPSLLDPSFDGSAAAWRDPERERLLLYSQPYLQNRLVLVGQRGADVSAAALSDLKGKRVAVVGGYSYGDSVEGAGAIFVHSAGEEDSLARLLKGSVDYTLMDDLVVQYILRNHPAEAGARLQIGSKALVTRDLHLALRRSHPDATGIIDRFNAHLRGMIADGTYHRLLHVDWIRADINGDGVPEYVPASDRPAAAEPTQIYTLFTTPEAAKESETKPGFYVGGNIYRDWASVPQSYKDSSTSGRPDARRSTGTIFKFTW